LPSDFIPPADERYADTVEAPDSAGKAQPDQALGLTILLHPEVERIGEVAPLVDFGSRDTRVVNRSEPSFCLPHGGEPRPLGVRFVSRRNVTLSALAGRGVRLFAEDATQARLDGEPLRDPVDLSPDQLECGRVLVLGKAVVLLVHLLARKPSFQQSAELIGDSPRMSRLRAEIARVADLDVPVLLRGETGVGKDLVARAIHGQSRRRRAPYWCVNLAAIPPGMAASELFGHDKGAFTGAERARVGYFERADGGTLFLDELGDTPPEVQPLLLRALESGEVQVLGSQTTRKVDVRTIAATDADLEQAISQGDFRRALLERLRGYELVIPPLRERRDDIARLFFHYLRRELEQTGEQARIDRPPPGNRAWVPASFVSWLVSYPWPGNVRQLRNVAQQVAIGNRGEARFEVSSALERLMQPEAHGGCPQAEEASAKPRTRASAVLSDDAIIQALREHRFNVSATAAALGLSRTWLFTRMDRCDRIRKASDLPADEVIASHRESDGNVALMAERLEVSSHGLKQRMRQLGLR
jgi:two-component system nitrogen regulation response regulator GlnG